MLGRVSPGEANMVGKRPGDDLGEDEGREVLSLRVLSLRVLSVKVLSVRLSSVLVLSTACHSSALLRVVERLRGSVSI